ncbi:MAG: hypothetical protein LBH07_02635 [Treponema sp.]|nr:hypothetical protein [Treponema sp.]
MQKKYGSLTGKLFLILIFAFIYSEQAGAQPSEKTTYRIGTGLGYTFAGYRDETDLPLNKYIDTFTFLIDGNIEKSNFFHSFNFGYFSGTIAAIPADPLLDEVHDDYRLFTYYQKESTFTRVYFQYALDYRLWGSDTFPGYLGGSFRGDLYTSHLVQTNYFNLTALVSHSIHASQKWIINKENMLVYSMGFPLLGYAARPPYAALYNSPWDTDNRIISLHNYQAVFGDFKYHHSINTLLSLNFGFGFELSRISFPEPRKDAAFRLNTGIAFTF